jgi:hypothetical protein
MEDEFDLLIEYWSSTMDRMKQNWQSWRMMWITLPWVIGVCVVMFTAHKDAVVGSRQHVTTGVITAHELHNHNQYRYRFSVNGATYTGISSAPNDVAVVNAGVKVYYDPQDPSTNSLEDFVGRNGQPGILPLLLLGIAGTAGVILSQKMKARRSGHQQG